MTRRGNLSLLADVFNLSVCRRGFFCDFVSPWAPGRGVAPQERHTTLGGGQLVEVVFRLSFDRLQTVFDMN